MFATSKTILSIVGLLFFVINTNAKPPNRFQKIAEEYNVFAYSLNYGYPIGYKWDENLPKAIIYLKNEQGYLEKLDNRTYVGAPTLENAEVIANFSPESFDVDKYCLIVDSSVVQSELSVFIDELMNTNLQMEICFVGGNGRYIKVTYEDWSSLKLSNNDCFQMYYDVLNIMVNSRDEILVEGHFVNVDNLFQLAFAYYDNNIEKNDQNINSINYTKIISNTVDAEIKRLEETLYTNEKKKLWEFELDRFKRIKKLTDKFGVILQPPRNFYVELKKQRNTSLKSWFKVLDQIQFGIHLARYKYFKKRFNGNYFDLYKRYDPLYLNLLEFTFPDRIMEKEDYYQEIPPPL